MAENKSDLDGVITQLTQDIENLKGQLQTASLSPSVDPSAPVKIAPVWNAPKGPINTALMNYAQRQTALTIQGAGFSLGNAGGWTTGCIEYSTMNTAIPGIHQMHSLVLQKHSVGDSAIIYGYNRHDGGISAASDEGATAITLQKLENEGYFHGTVAATTGKGDQAPVMTFTSGNNWHTFGAYMMNISKRMAAGNVLSPSQPLVFSDGENSFLNFLPVTQGILPISTACGVLDVPITNKGVTPDSPISCTFTVRLKQIQGKLPLFTEGSYVVVGGTNSSEQSQVLVAADRGDGTQTLTMLLRNPNQASVIFQEGIAGCCISFGANLRFSGMRSSYPALGSLTGSDLIYLVNVAGGTFNNILPQLGCEAAKNDGGPNSDIELFQSAEVVYNPEFFAAKGTLEQNPINWAVGDLTENPHYYIGGGSIAWFISKQITPSNSIAGSVGLKVDIGGTGYGGGNSRTVEFVNYNPASFYRGNGGPLDAPLAINIFGPHYTGIRMSSAHEPGGATTEVMNPNNPKKPLAAILDKSYNWLPGANLWFLGEKGYWQFDGPLNADSGLLYKGNKGAYGTYTTADGKTVTVQGGIITSIV